MFNFSTVTIVIFVCLFSQDLEMYDLEDFGYNSVNITSFRLIDHTPENARIIEDMQRFNAKSYSKVLQVISQTLPLLIKDLFWRELCLFYFPYFP